MKQLALALALTAATGAAFAQANITSMTGMVTMSTGNQMVSVTPGMAVPAGANLVATGSATVTFASGCVAVLTAGQSMPATEAACQANVAARAGQGSNFAGNSNLLIGAGVAGGLAVAYKVKENRKPNNPISPS